MKSYFWTEDSFGWLLPDDWEEIVSIEHQVASDCEAAKGEDDTQDYFLNFVELDSFCDDCQELMGYEAQSSWKLDSIGFCEDDSYEAVSACYERLYGSSFTDTFHDPDGDEADIPAEYEAYKAAGWFKRYGIIATFWADSI